jgi:hypothetical protein
MTTTNRPGPPHSLRHLIKFVPQMCDPGSPRCGRGGAVARASGFATAGIIPGGGKIDPRVVVMVGHDDIASTSEGECFRRLVQYVMVPTARRRVRQRERRLSREEKCSAPSRAITGRRSRQPKSSSMPEE